MSAGCGGVERLGAGRWGLAGRLVLAALLGLLAMLPSVSHAAAQGAQAQPQNVTIDDLVQAPNRYLGQTVTLIGEVERIFGPRSFLLVDNDLLSEEAVPVVVSRPLLGREGFEVDAALTLNRQDLLQVTGTVHQLNVRAFEDRLNLDLNDQVLTPFAGRPALIAHSAVLEPDVPVGIDVGGVTIDDIVENPQRYFGQRVIVHGELELPRGPRSFVLEELDLTSDQSVLVVTAQPAPQPLERLLDIPVFGDFPARGKRLWVRGTVQPFDLTAIEQRLGVDLLDELADDYQGRPVIIAERVSRTPFGTALGREAEQPGQGTR